MVDIQNSKLEAKSIFDLTEFDSNGEQIHLKKYSGKVCLVVNISSKDPSSLSTLSRLNNLKMKIPDLTIFAFPCCQFGPTESLDELLDYLNTHNIVFDEIFNIVEVNGPNTSNVYKFLKCNRPKNCGTLIINNFMTFIINREGKPVERLNMNKLLPSIEDLLKIYM